MTERLDQNGVEAYMKGFPGTATVDKVLAVTDILLAEKPPSTIAPSTTTTTLPPSAPEPPW